MEANCCACLNPETIDTIAKNDFLAKLKHLVPEVPWDENWSICETCSDLLGQIEAFKKRCSKSEEIRNYQPPDEQSQTSEHECKLCEKIYKTEHGLKQHVARIHTDKSQLNCDSCKQKFETLRKLLNHCSEIHGIDKKSIKPYDCGWCDKKFATSSLLAQHKKYHEGDRSHICSYCGKGFIMANDLKIHEKQHLNKREYKCEQCGKGFNTHKDIRTHRIVVHSDPNSWNHVCRYCDKRFPMKSSLDQHVRRHVGDKRFNCHLCDKKFIDKIVLQKHIGSHSNVRPYKCTECKKEYKDKKILELHLAKMHGIGDAKTPIKVRVKKFNCDLCLKSYYDKTKLTKHMYFHTGERPFTCKICLKGFTDRSYVSKHLRTVHNVTEDEIIY